MSVKPAYQVSRPTLTGLLCTVFLLLLAPTATLTADPSPPNDSSPLWHFTFRIENSTAHDVHVRILENSDVVLDQELKDARPTLTVSGAHQKNIDGADYPDHFAVIDTIIPLHGATRQLTISENEHLHVTKTFDISGFTLYPTLDFRLRLTPTGIALTHDYHTVTQTLADDEGTSREELIRSRTLAPERRIYIFNKTRHPIIVIGSVDNNICFRQALPATRERDEGVIVHDPGPDPAVRLAARISARAHALTIAETRYLHVNHTFDITDFAKQQAPFAITVSDKGITLEYADFSW
jgi:hypothetical protein